MPENRRIAVDLGALDEKDRKLIRDEAKELDFEVIFADGKSFVV